MCGSKIDKNKRTNSKPKMSKSSEFDAFKNAADVDEGRCDEYVTTQRQLTVAELMHILRTIVNKDPTMRDAPVFHVEFGSITPSIIVTVTEDRKVVISES